MITYLKLRLRICDGSLKYLCCMSPAQLQDLRTVLHGMSADEANLLYREVCNACGIGEGPVNPGMPGMPTMPTGSPADCAQKLAAVLCTPVGTAAKVLIKSLLFLYGATGGATIEGPTVSLYVGKLIDAMDAICAEPAKATQYVNVVCNAWMGLKTSQLPGATPADLNTFGKIIAWVAASQVGVVMDQCCDASLVSGSIDRPDVLQTGNATVTNVDYDASRPSYMSSNDNLAGRPNTFLSSSVASLRANMIDQRYNTVMGDTSTQMRSYPGPAARVPEGPQRGDYAKKL